MRDLEAEAATLAEKRAGAEEWDGFKEKILRRSQGPQGALLTLSPPALDPRAATRSCLELYLLVCCIGGFGVISEPPLERLIQWFAELLRNPATRPEVRGGYFLISEVGQRPCLFPAFAAALLLELPAHDILTLFPDLWVFDFALWRSLDRKEPVPAPELARLWLLSPSRYLLGDLGVLSEKVNASLLQRYYRAAGVHDVPADSRGWQLFRKRYDAWLNDHPEGWRRRHATILGFPLTHFVAADFPNLLPLQAMTILEDVNASPTLHCALLGLLLDRCDVQPMYQLTSPQSRTAPGQYAVRASKATLALEQIQATRPLTEDLTLILTQTLFAAWGPLNPANVAVEIETQLYLRAALLCDADRLPDGQRSPGATYRCYGVARWLAACLAMHPSFQNQTLLYELRRRKLTLPKRDQDLDPLHPAHLVNRRLPLSEIAMLAVLARHYKGTAITSGYCPPPLTRALKEIAARLITNEELEAERLLKNNAAQLDWPGQHVAPPLAARALLTDLHVGWLWRLDSAPFEQMAALFQEQHQWYPWFTAAVYEEGKALRPISKRLARILHALLPDWALTAGAAARMAAGLLSELTEADHDIVYGLAYNAAKLGHITAVEALISGATSNEEWDLWRRCAELLLKVIRAPWLAVDLRLSAVTILARWLEQVSVPEHLTGPLRALLQKVVAKQPLLRGTIKAEQTLQSLKLL